ncbi:LPS export ABC transporter periplasmic protein LptC [Teichococcus aestuarii]|uniref:LPS export ABC transporter periplasmic protein LptC n=1 Tax=Teichococcus aestuarii TaxID=568898 RepID=A0A2U1V815_9PROT|nr:LPS export ABC transporter periplasmic protein LptC [Pseudoroseomonas aestuarii]PWC30033.1 LPS export ABC transporter periplasmic protein LptC [Pseudoroseomonas aestuarii]
MTPSTPPRDALAAQRASRAPGRSRTTLPSRARMTMDAGALARRRVLVKLAKWLLPVGALGLLAAIALWPEFDSAEERGRLAFRRVAQTSAEAMRIASARYQGLDEQNRPYNVTATTATQQVNTDLIDLERPRADLFMADGAWVLLEAQQGRYARASNQLALSGQVTLWHDDGSTLRTEAAQIDVAGGSARGDRPVAAQGPFGTLVSEGFRLENRGQVVVFTGNAKAVLEGAR